MKTIFKILPFLFMLGCMPVITSCSDDDDEEFQNDLVGTWKLEKVEGYDDDDDDDDDDESGVTETITFAKDKKVIMDGDTVGEWSVKSGKIYIYYNYGEENDTEIITIISLNSTTLIIEGRGDDNEKIRATFKKV